LLDHGIGALVIQFFLEGAVLLLEAGYDLLRPRRLALQSHAARGWNARHACSILLVLLGSELVNLLHFRSVRRGLHRFRVEPHIR